MSRKPGERSNLFAKWVTKRQQRHQRVIDAYSNQKLADADNRSLYRELDRNLEIIRHSIGKSDDLVIRDFQIKGNPNLKAALIYIDGLVNADSAGHFILRASMFELRLPDELTDQEQEMDLSLQIKNYGLPSGEVDKGTTFQEVYKCVLSGDSALLLDNSATSLLINTKGWDRRGVEEPQTESVVRGPRDGFTETLRTNSALIRLRLKDPDLRFKNLMVGRRSNTNVAVMYIENLADQSIVDQVVERIRGIDIDGALESGYIEQFIEDNHWTPFPLIQNTERPDKATANLLEGKVIILVDGTPFVLIAPAIFSQFYQSPEDYYERVLIGTLIRGVRIISMAMALLLPSLYIAFSSYHPEMIPSRLVFAMAAGRSTVPFPSIVEAFLMEVAMEILREASVRLPGPIGQTIGIVGALVVGQAAVQAGIVSPIMVIIVALTTIGSFASPSYSAAIALRMLRFPMMLAAGVFGLYGIMLLLIVLIIHLCSLKSFGVPYMAPFAPMHLKDLKDTIIRAPLYRMKQRPISFQPANRKREGADQAGVNSNGKAAEQSGRDDSTQS
ncbi:spore germination protein [Paenibacillus senegalensis]|uniref:spore germination protein n=1 Tax=Paenibacillus senegalensis TaxID=1465766 RepID=UPI00028932F5|nr:spore germination protein [Paenibacillus senegalensis]